MWNFCGSFRILCETMGFFFYLNKIKFFAILVECFLEPSGIFVLLCEIFGIKVNFSMEFLVPNFHPGRWISPRNNVVLSYYHPFKLIHICIH